MHKWHEMPQSGHVAHHGGPRGRQVRRASFLREVRPEVSQRPRSRSANPGSGEAIPEADDSALGQAECPECGIKFVEFRNTGRLGCPHDYEVLPRGADPTAREHSRRDAPLRQGRRAGCPRRSRWEERARQAPGGAPDLKAGGHSRGLRKPPPASATRSRGCRNRPWRRRKSEVAECDKRRRDEARRVGSSLRDPPIGVASTDA